MASKALAEILAKSGVVTEYVPVTEMINQKIAAGRHGGWTEDEILTDILADVVKRYEPYDTVEAFGAGFVDGQVRRNRSAEYGDTYHGQAYDRGTEAAMWYWTAQQRLKQA